jgi:hypothetical protein
MLQYANVYLKNLEIYVHILKNMRGIMENKVLGSLVWYEIVASKIGNCTISYDEIKSYIDYIKQITEENNYLKCKIILLKEEIENGKRKAD